MGKIKINNKLLQSIPDTLERKVAYYRSQGHEIPEMKLIKTPEQIEGIRRSGIVNTGILDLIEKEIRPGISTAAIDQLESV